MRLPHFYSPILVYHSRSPAPITSEPTVICIRNEEFVSTLVLRVCSIYQRYNINDFVPRNVLGAVKVEIDVAPDRQ